jgi:hypothetical protein
MRSILMSVMFIMVVIVIYMNTVGGDEGAKEKLKESGERINHTIERINVYGEDY